MDKKRRTGSGAFGRAPVLGSVLVVFVVVAGTAVGSLAWAEDGANELTRRAFFEPVEVPLVSVDVYVSDSDGKPVQGLTLEDFEVFEDGVPVEPSHFYAAPGARIVDGEEGEVPPARELTRIADQLLMAVWIDETALLPQRRRTALEHLRGFLIDDLPDTVNVSLVSYDGNARIRQAFTADRQKLSAELAVMMEQGASASRVNEEQFLIHRIQNYSRSPATMSGDDVASFAEGLLGEVEAFAAQAHQRAQHSLRNLGEFIDALGVLPGQKVVLVVSDAVNLRPGERLYTELQRIFGDRAGLSGVSAMSFGRRYDLTRDFRSLLRRANTNRVTFITLSAITERSLGFISAESRGAAAADMDQMMLEEQALITMAGVTGGKVLANSEALGEQLNAVAEAVAAYYSVGYVPPNPSDGEYHRLEIKVKRSGVTVRHREGYISSGDAGGLVDRTIAAAMLGVSENPLGITVEIRNLDRRDDGNFLVPALIRVPIGELVMVPGLENHEGKISLVVVVRSEDGGMSESEVRQYPVVVPNDKLVQATTSSAGYTIGLVMRPGPHRVSVGVEDELAGVSATTVATVDVGVEE